MAAATRSRSTKAAAKAKPAPEPTPEEDFDEELVESETDEDLEELEADEVADSKPATKSTAQEVTFGIRDLVALIKKQTGQETDPRAIRTLIRRMARDQSGRVNREIVPGNRQRYDWSGPNDPEVLAIVKAFKAGELEVEKKAKLDKLKADKAAKTAAKKKAAPAVEEVEEDDEEEAPAPARRTAKKTTAARRKAKPAPVEEVEDDEEIDLDEDDE